MKTNQAEAVSRLKTLYAKQGEDRVFARMHVPLPPGLSEKLARRSARIPTDAFPSPEQLFPLWEEYLAFHDDIEDDWVPSVYPRQYDQGIYGTLFGARMEQNDAGTPGWVCSNTRPIEGTSYAELARLAADSGGEWTARMENDLRRMAAMSGGRWGVSVAITIDGFNLAQQIRGYAMMLDIYDCPDELKRFLQAGVRLNIELVERQRAAIGMACEGGVYDFFNAGWMPAQGIPMSVDCYNMCSPEVYAEFGRPYQQQLIDHFGGGNFHIHGNGRHLLPELAKLRGCVVSMISDDGSDVRAMDDVANIKRLAGPVIPVVPFEAEAFARGLRERSLPGGVYYLVGPLESSAEANRLMESVRSYRV